MHPYGVPASGENLANVIRHYGKTTEVFILKSTHSKFITGKGLLGRSLSSILTLTSRATGSFICPRRSLGRIKPSSKIPRTSAQQVCRNPPKSIGGRACQIPQAHSRWIPTGVPSRFYSVKGAELRSSGWTFCSMLQ